MIDDMKDVPVHDLLVETKRGLEAVLRSTWRGAPSSAQPGRTRL